MELLEDESEWKKDRIKKTRKGEKYTVGGNCIMIQKDSESECRKKKERL